MTLEQSDEALQRFVDGFASPPRSPVLHLPSEHGLEYEDITFPARDGLPVEGWFIPAPWSSKLIICNHPLGFSRSGIPPTCSPGMSRLTGLRARVSAPATWRSGCSAGAWARSRRSPR
jgi:uncharacterized protein